MNIAILNCSTGSFVPGQHRLRKSLEKLGWGDRLRFWTDSWPEGFPGHDRVPWGFKYYAMKEARQAGADIVLWLDTSIVAIRPLRGLFQKIRKRGYFLWGSAGIPMGQWCSDAVLERWKLPREVSMGIEELAASVIGIDFRHRKGRALYEELFHWIDEGYVFRGAPDSVPLSDIWVNANQCISQDNRVLGHRHDQTVLSYCAWKAGLTPSYAECFDFVIGQKADGSPRYADQIPLTTVLLQNRDIKNRVFLTATDAWAGTKGLKRLGFWGMSAYKTLVMIIKTTLFRLRGMPKK